MLVNIIGVAGDILIILAFFLLQTKRIRSGSLIYTAFNLIGSLAVLYSLMYDWNLPAFIVECAWVIISAWGLLCYIRERLTK